MHPALLPAFGGAGMYGHKVHEAVIERGLRLTGPTVHFVDERYDEGPIIAQSVVPVDHSWRPDEMAQAGGTSRKLCWPRRSSWSSMSGSS